MHIVVQLVYRSVEIHFSNLILDLKGMFLIIFKPLVDHYQRKVCQTDVVLKV